MERKTILADGMFFDRPREGAPDFVKGKLSFNVEKAVAFLKEHANAKGYVNLDLKKSKEGNLYLSLNDWKPEGNVETKDTTPEYPAEDINPEDIPF